MLRQVSAVACYLQYDAVGGGGRWFIFPGEQLGALRGRGGVQALWACLGLYSLAGLRWVKRAGVPLLGGIRKEGGGGWLVPLLKQGLLLWRHGMLAAAVLHRPQVGAIKEHGSLQMAEVRWLAGGLAEEHLAIGEVGLVVHGAPWRSRQAIS